MTINAPLWPDILGSFHGQGSWDEVDMIDDSSVLLFLLWKEY